LCEETQRDQHTADPDNRQPPRAPDNARVLATVNKLLDYCHLFLSNQDYINS